MSNCNIKPPIFDRVKTSGTTGLDFPGDICIIPEREVCYLVLEEDRNLSLLQEDGFNININCIDGIN